MRGEQRETDKIPLGLPFTMATAISHSGLTPGSLLSPCRTSLVLPQEALGCTSRLPAGDTVPSFWSLKPASSVLGWQSYFPSCRFCCHVCLVKVCSVPKL